MSPVCAVQGLRRYRRPSAVWETFSSALAILPFAGTVISSALTEAVIAMAVPRPVPFSPRSRPLPSGLWLYLPACRGAAAAQASWCAAAPPSVG